MNSKTKQILLYGTALFTIIAAIFAPSEQETVQPVQTQKVLLVSQTSSTNIKVSSEASRLMPKSRNSLTDEPGDLFYVNKPPPAKALKLELPVAPPLPYLYMGKMIENGVLTIFLTRDNKPYVAHSGDILDNEYRINAIHPPLMEFTYLPLKQNQALNIGEYK